MSPNRAHVIVLSNQKGGCGKTSAATNLAAGFAREGYRTCLVDIDSQCNATTALGLSPEKLKDEGKFTVADAFLASKPASNIEISFEGRFDGKLSMIPGHRAVDQVEAILDVELKKAAIADDFSPMEQDDLRNEHRRRLRKSLSSLINNKDLIVIDTPPRLGFELTSALMAADWYLIPVFASKYDADGLSRLTETVKKIRSRANPALRLLGIVLGRYKETTNLHKQVRAKLSETFGEKFFSTVINDSVRHEEAPYLKQTIYEHAPNELAAEQFTQLTRECLARLFPDVTSKQVFTTTPANDAVSEPAVVLAEASNE